MLKEPHVDFDFEALDPEPPGEVEADPGLDPAVAELIAFERRRGIYETLKLLTDGTNALGAGRRAFVLAHELKAGTFRRKLDLAKKLRVPPCRISQILKVVRCAIANIHKGLDAPEHPPRESFP